MSAKDAQTILLCGVGGQGTITAADLLARAASAVGFQVKVSEIHGMAQRGGAVTTLVRFGDEVHSMVACRGQADAVVSFETTEALRNIEFLAKDGFLLVSDLEIKPMTVASGSAHMPLVAKEQLNQAGALLIDSRDIALKAGNAKCENVVLLGALESRLNFGAEVWDDVIRARVPEKTILANLEAFRLGLEFASR